MSAGAASTLWFIAPRLCRKDEGGLYSSVPAGYHGAPMPSMSYVHRFLTTLVQTGLTELAVLFFLMTYVLKGRGITPRQLLFAGLFASFSTIPYVWFVFPRSGIPWARQTSLYFSEPFVMVIEALFYRMYLRTSWKDSFIISLVCNASSYYLDIILRANGLWLYW